MAKIEVYTTTFCPFCIRAKALLDQKGVSYTEINLQDKPDKLKLIKAETGWRTVPIVFIDGELIGGYVELQRLENSGELDQRLACK